MKKLGLILMSAMAMVALNSCEKESSADVSRVTSYPDFDRQGSEVILHPLGTPFVDPGVTATEAGNEIDVAKSVRGVFRVGPTSQVDGNTADHYIITYSAVNQDGFAGTTTRDVWVANTGDLVNSIEGLYTSTIVRNGVVSAQYADLEYVLIWKNADGTYGISDAIGGYYDIGRGFGTAYTAQGATITANDISANDFSYGGPVPVGLFGGNAQISQLMVDPATNVITFTTTWDLGFIFEVTLNQVQL